MKKIISFMMAVAMVLCCCVGCGKSDSGDTIKIGMQGPYTGETAVYGLAVRNGAQLYFDQINAAGGINGKKIEVIVYDNKGVDA